MWIGFGLTLGDRKRENFWPGSNDIGRACNIFHAEHVSGSK